MWIWTAPSTLLLFLPPAERPADKRIFENLEVQGKSSSLLQAWPAVGRQGVFTAAEFATVWRVFFGARPEDGSCGAVHSISSSERELIHADAFLVKERGFSRSLCDPQAWFIASARIDPCRLRMGEMSGDAAAVSRCAQGGKYSEIRFVLQPVGRHDRGAFFPDAALHVAFSIDPRGRVARAWKTLVRGSRKESGARFSEFLSVLKKESRRNDVSIFVAGAGLERWSFARVKFDGQQWQRDRLFHGGFHESISDADVSQGQLRTALPEKESVFTASDFLDPLKVNPLQGSCVGCHLAEGGRPSRLFRLLGWGLEGEPVVSVRVQREAQQSAHELNLLFARRSSRGKGVRNESPAPSSRD